MAEKMSFKQMTGLKKFYTTEEMYELYKSQSPLVPNKQVVGRFAKQMGFRPIRQMIHGKSKGFYISNNY